MDPLHSIWSSARSGEHMRSSFVQGKDMDVEKEEIFFFPVEIMLHKSGEVNTQQE